MRLRHFSLIPFLLLMSLAVSAAPRNPVVIGDARFTVITPLCIRMEYSASGQFVDQKSLFAVNRAARDAHFLLTQAGGATIIDTGVIRLTYTPNGQGFSPANLQAVIQDGGVTGHWTPGAPNPGNLGGTIRTLDGATGPEDLGQGLISRDGWDLIDDSTTPLLTNDWVEARPATDGTDWYLFGYGDNYQGALRSLAVISGPVPLPRKYVLGSWYSRYWSYTSAQFMHIVNGYAAHDFPLDMMVMDMGWHTTNDWTGWSWNRTLIPHPTQLLGWFHQQGLHVTLNMHPADGVGPWETRYPEFMRAMGADSSTGKTIPFDAANQQYMDAWFNTIIDPLEAQGVDFWWLDWQQYPDTRSIPSLTNLFWLNTLLYRHTQQGGLRGQSFSRWAGWGDQRHPIEFSGDADTGFPMLAFEVPFTSTAGNMGCFFWSHDIGGHVGPRNPESYARWVQFGATSPVLRIHSTQNSATDRRPWRWPVWAANSMRIAFHLRSQLFPYIYSSAAETCRDTIPLDRPMYIEYPKINTAYHQAQQYFFGDNLLVAPIVAAGVGPGHVQSQTVWFPPGDWDNLFTGEHFTGPSYALVSADINEFPLYAKGGVPIPMQPYSPRMGTAPLSTLVVRCYPGVVGKKGAFSLYEDDGQTQAYKQGAFAVTPLTYVRHGNRVTVTVGAARGHYVGQAPQRNITIELADTGRAVTADAGAKPISVTYDAVAQTNQVTVNDVPIRKPLTVVVQVTPPDLTSLRLAAVKRRMSGILGKTVTGNTVRAALLSALAQTNETDVQNALLAAAGIGLAAHNMAPYLYNGTLQDEFFAPPGFLNGSRVHLVGGATEPIPPDSFVKASGPTLLHRHTKITEPGQVKFAVGPYQFLQPASLSPMNDLLSPSNIAATATVTASGSQSGCSPEGAVDGILGGYPGNITQEWSSGQTTGAWLQLSWNTPQTVDRVALYDRPNLTDQVTSGTLTFSDGTVIPFGTLPNDGQTGLTVSFPAKTITWVKITITAVAPGTQNSGFSEVAVYRAGTNSPNE